MTQKMADRIEQVLFWAFIAGIAWCPFWFGSNDLIAWGINAFLFPSIVVLYEIVILWQDKRRPVEISRLKVPIGLFAAVLAWIIIQNATWTPSSWHNSIWEMTARVLETPVDGSISVNRDLTTLALIRLITNASAFWLALQLCREASRAQSLINAIAAIASVYAAYGLISYALTPGHVLWLDFQSTKGVVTSTFINRNSYATYAGIGLIAICAAILQIYRSEGSISSLPTRLRIASFIAITGRKGAVLLGGGCLVFVALLMTGSRGGFLATSVALVIFIGLRVWRTRQNKIGRLVAALALLSIASLIYFDSGDTLSQNITNSGADSNRMAVYLITLRSILDSPILGYGYGTFVDVFPMFRDHSISITGTWYQAHNTYLEIFQGLGILYGSMLMGSIIFLVIRCIKSAMNRKKRGTIPLCAACVALLVGVHSLIDFSLQIEAVAITFMAILGAGVAQSENAGMPMRKAIMPAVTQRFHT